MKILKSNILFLALTATVFSSCDDFLDVNPDDRAEVNSYDKVNSLLVSAYAGQSSDFILEMSSDNVTDNGTAYSSMVNQNAAYRWRDITTEGNDDPRSIWNNCYNAVATANEALKSINDLGDTEELQDLKAEALLCRAYGMFQLANTFCMAYNPDKADEYPGLPYPTEPETTVNKKYVRGTLRELYENIDADIEAALPHISDDHYTSPKYRFNVKAAYAFAARFNLFYMNYDKAITYATQVLGNDPSNMLRDYSAYLVYSNVDDISNAYINSSLPANLMMQTAVSTLGRWTQGSSSYRRFHHNRTIVTYETIWAAAPWGTGSSDANNSLYVSHMVFGTDQLVYFPKMLENFEYTDKVNATGYPHIVDAVFTADETLLVRAEAYAMKKNYTAAISDMNAWIASHCSPTYGTHVRPVLTENSINTFMDALAYAAVTPESTRDRSIKKKFNPQGFTVETGTQENILQLVLHMRRIETLFQGQRFLDIKRYGIEFSHELEGEEPVVFTAGDLRGAIQLPNDVITAGLEANPR